MKADLRRAPPLSVKLAVALNQLEAAMRRLGIIPAECTVPDWQLDHDPALGLRAVDDDSGDHVPHQHDVRFLVWRPRAEHAAKTTGRRGESDLSLRDGDQAKIAKVKRRDRKRAAQEAAAVAGTPSERLKAKRPIPARAKPARDRKPSPCRRPTKAMPRRSFTENSR